MARVSCYNLHKLATSGPPRFVPENNMLARVKTENDYYLLQCKKTDDILVHMIMHINDLGLEQDQLEIGVKRTLFLNGDLREVYALYGPHNITEVYEQLVRLRIKCMMGTCKQKKVLNLQEGLHLLIQYHIDWDTTVYAVKMPQQLLFTEENVYVLFKDNKYPATILHMSLSLDIIKFELYRITNLCTKLTFPMALTEAVELIEDKEHITFNGDGNDENSDMFYYHHMVEETYEDAVDISLEIYKELNSAKSLAKELEARLQQLQNEFEQYTFRSIQQRLSKLS